MTPKSELGSVNSRADFSNDPTKVGIEVPALGGVHSDPILIRVIGEPMTSTDLTAALRAT